MLSLPHIVIGAATGLAMSNPFSAFVAGIVSHHLMDMVPHFDLGTIYFKKNKKELWTPRDLSIAGVDLILAIIVLWFLWSRSVGFGNLSNLVLFGGLGGVFPDVWHHTPLWKKYTRSWPISSNWYRFHNTFHATVPPKFAWFGIVTQLVFIVFALFVIRLFVPLW